MGLVLKFSSHQLEFKRPAGTSRGTLNNKLSWFIKIHEEADPTIVGIGEISTLPRLSIDHDVQIDDVLKNLQKDLISCSMPGSIREVYDLVSRIVSQNVPSVRFGLETALLDLINGGHREIYKNEFYLASKPIPINGLIWMGELKYMKEQVDEKIEEGYNCLKIKVGAINFDKELELVEYIHSQKKSDDFSLRLDANGGFLTNEALMRLKRLSKFNIHSIEQPIMPKQWEAMTLICEKSEIPIALDEELIGVFGYQYKKQMLDEIRPAYIILKPSLLGGFHATQEWIEVANELNIGWWITSALESNIGLNAIAQFTTEMGSDLPQGLGTGQLYTNNIPSPLIIKDQSIQYDPSGTWDLNVVDFGE